MVSAPPPPPTASDCYRPAARDPPLLPGLRPQPARPLDSHCCRRPWAQCSARRRRPARRARVDTVDPPTPPRSTPSTRRSTPSTRPHGSGRHCGPPQIARVDTVDPTPRIGSSLSTAPSCSGRHRRPATELGSTPSTRTCPRLAAVAPRTVLESTPSTRPCPPASRLSTHPCTRVDHTNARLFQESARNGSQRAEVSQGLVSEGIAKADSGNK